MAESLFRATEEEKLEILSKYQAFVFDMDGTLWRGTQLIAGAAEVLDLLRYQVLARGGLDRFHACCHDGVLGPHTLPLSWQHHLTYRCVTSSTGKEGFLCDQQLHTEPAGIPEEMPVFRPEGFSG